MRKLYTVLLALVVLLFAAAGCFFLTDIDEGENIIVRFSSESGQISRNVTDRSGYIELLPGETVNINSADASALKKLPGIGEKLAENIIEYRQRQGGFEKADDILNVDGIGEGRFESIRELIVTGNE